jgi:hypothetical protein
MSLVYTHEPDKYDEYIITKKERFIMATYSSKQEKRQVYGNYVPVLVSVLLIGVLVILAPLNASFYSSLNGFLGTWSSADNVYINAEVISFSADQTYWDANCDHGWTSDATCDGILARVESCAISVTSPYCSSYESYMQVFRK